MRQQLPDRRLDWRASSEEELSRQERDLLQRYMDAHADGNPDALAELLREDLRFAMPPEPGSWVGRDAIVQSWIDGGFGSDTLGRWQCWLTRANPLGKAGRSTTRLHHQARRATTRLRRQCC